MSYCLYCLQTYSESWSWASFLGISTEVNLCGECNDKLKKIEGELCRICGRMFSLFPEQYRQDDLCYDCIRWEEDENWRGILTKNRSLYVYNDFLKEVIAKLKYRGDAELVKAFHPTAQTLYIKYFKNQILVPIPLSEERHYERGFNQAEIFAEVLSRKVLKILARQTHEEKQSKKDREARMAKKENPFKVLDKICGKKIVLIDDVYTTGSTVRYAAKALIEAGAERVCSLTIGR